MRAHPLVEILRDITSPRKRPWILILIGLFLVSAAWKTKLGAPREPTPPPETVEYHYREWRRHVTAWSRRNQTNRFSIHAIVNRLEGNISLGQRHDKIQEHEAALVRLDYFGEFNFDPKGADVSKLMAQFYTNTLNTDLHLYVWTASATYTSRTNIHITARIEDIPKLQSLFNQLTNTFFKTR